MQYQNPMLKQKRNMIYRQSKINQLVEFYVENEIDIAIITKTNTKQNTKANEIIKTKFKELGRSLEIIEADSKAYNTTA